MFLLRVFLVSVRLKGVNSSDQMGRVEFSLNGVWGTVCDDTWNIRNAHVICGMMGLPPATAALGSAVFGRGQGVIWLDTLNCVGNESSILECEHGVFGNINGCSHYSDSGIMCGINPCKLLAFIFLKKSRGFDCFIISYKNYEDFKILFAFKSHTTVHLQNAMICTSTILPVFM